MDKKSADPAVACRCQTDISDSLWFQNLRSECGVTFCGDFLDFIYFEMGSAEEAMPLRVRHRPYVLVSIIPQACAERRTCLKNRP